MLDLACEMVLTEDVGQLELDSNRSTAQLEKANRADLIHQSWVKLFLVAGLWMVVGCSFGYSEVCVCVRVRRC